jgi:hypothetical protein
MRDIVAGVLALGSMIGGYTYISSDDPELMKALDTNPTEWIGYFIQEDNSQIYCEVESFEMDADQNTTVTITDLDKCSDSLLNDTTPPTNPTYPLTISVTPSIYFDCYSPITNWQPGESGLEPIVFKLDNGCVDETDIVYDCNNRDRTLTSEHVDTFTAYVSNQVITIPMYECYGLNIVSGNVSLDNNDKVKFVSAGGITLLPGFTVKEGTELTVLQTD